MERRSFLKGVFGGATAGGILITACQADVDAFVATVKKNDKIVSSPLMVSGGGFPLGMVLYDHLGRPVAIVESTSREMEDVTSIYDTWKFWKPSKRMTITAVSLGEINV